MSRASIAISTVVLAVGSLTNPFSLARLLIDVASVTSRSVTSSRK
jgi:hypothetical protein